MQLTAILLLAVCLQVSAKGYGQSITLSEKNAPLEKVFREIKSQCGYTFVYRDEWLKEATNVNIDIHNASLELALEACFRNQPLTYTLVKTTVVVRLKSPVPGFNPGDLSTTSSPPPIDIHGRVTDSLGNSLAGASVTVKGTKRGTSTDANGNFTLYGVNDNATLVISDVGYEELLLKVKGRNQIVISLKLHSTALTEVVVNKGYYTTTQALNTGNVAIVSGADIQKQPVTDPILALEGRVPGLYIQQASGVPGAYSQISIRGQNSIANGNDPLYIIDGVPFSSLSLSTTFTSNGAVGYVSTISNSQGGAANGGGGLSPFNALNPADIESVVVLKDADATAIYGSRGANGVILITTKQGKPGKTKFDLNVYTGKGEVNRMMPLMNTQQYLAMRREAFQNDGIPVPSIVSNPYDYNYDIDGVWDTTRYTNWQKVLIGNPASFTNIQGNISGGNANTQFIVGVGYSVQGMVYIGNYSDQKASTHFSLTNTSENQRFHLQLSANYVFDNNNQPPADFTNYISGLAPDAPALYDTYGNLNWQPYGGSITFYSNPAAYTFQSFKAATNNLISNLTLSYQLLPGLVLKSSFGYNQDEMNQNQIMPSTSLPPPSNTQDVARSLIFVNTTFQSWIIEPQLDYKTSIGSGHIEALVGSTFHGSSQNSFTQQAYGFSSDALITDQSAAEYQRYYGGNYTLYRYNAIYGRLSYNLGDKYLINLTGRRDGSSRFGPEKEFGNFGAVGLGWIFSKESLVQNSLPFLSFGKLRGSYGTTGSDQIGDYQYLSTYSPNSYTYQELGGLNPTRLTNPLFAWEVDKKLEGGIELGFIKDRVQISASYFRNRTGNQLVGYPMPSITGFGYVQYNLPATVQNTGLELVLKSINIKTKDFTWMTSVNLTVPKNKLIAYPDLQTSNYSNTYIIGKPLSIQELYHSTGVNPQTGLYSFATKDGSGNPSYPQDVVVTPPVTQKFYGGIDNTFSYKGFSLDIFIQFVDQLGYNYQNYFQSAGGLFANEPTYVLSRWQSSGDISNTQRFGTTGASRYTYGTLRHSDGTITDASFLRLKNLAFSYQFPASWVNKMSLQSARLYLQCQNLITITKYLGLDPESGGLNLPPLRMITAGLQVGF